MGANPLIGPASPDWGPRFPDLSCVYDRRLCRALVKSANRLGLHLKRGLYAAVSGPAYETPAEVSALRRMGADAVGMSTVPEAILAHAAGLRVVGLSCIANAAAARGRRLAHADVLTGAAGAAPRLTRLLTAFLGDLHATSAE
jgi:purine-nucleoside phosphorylase